MKQFLFVCLMISGLWASAQVVNKPIRWSFELKKVSDHNYTILAKAKMEPGWHVFTPDPGGDGFLIPTSVLLEASENITHPEKWVVNSKVVTKDMPEVGVVNYLEGEAQLSMPIKVSAARTTIKGTFTYQSCNDHMCLPPVDEVFTFEIKE